MEPIVHRLTYLSGLLMNSPRYMEGNTGAKGKAARTQAESKPSPEVEAERNAYKLEGGRLYVPCLNFRQSLVDGGKFRKIGRAYASGLLLASVFPIESPCILIDPETKEAITDYVIDVRRAVIPSSGAGVVRARPLIPKWQVDVEFSYDEAMIDPEIITEVFKIAGRAMGVCDYCPKHKGPFGRYAVERIA